MSKFGGSNSKKDVPGISSGSLSDIVFMLLFFFMVTTQLRETENKVIVKLPEATEVAKLERKDLTSYINIGTPVKHLQGMYGTDARIQLNDSFKTVDDIRDFVERERAAMSTEDQARMTVSIKADRDVPMGLIADVKQALQKSFALKINYSASEK